MARFLWERFKAQMDVTVTLGLAWLFAHKGFPVAAIVILAVSAMIATTQVKKNPVENLISRI